MTRFLRQDSNVLRLPGHIPDTSFPELSWLASARAAHNTPQHSITWRGCSTPASSSVALETPFVFSVLNCVLPPHVFLPALAAELPFHSHRSSPTTGVSNDAGSHTAPMHAGLPRFTSFLEYLPAPASFLREVHRLAAQLRVLTPNLDTKRQHKAATDAGTGLSGAMVKANNKIRVASLLLQVVPPDVLEKAVSSPLCEISAQTAVDAIVMRVQRGSGQKQLEDAVRDWRGLTAHMAAQGGHARRRARCGSVSVLDLNLYLLFRQDRALMKHAGPASAALHSDNVPRPHLRDGSSSTESVKTKFKVLEDSWSFDIPMDARVRVPSPHLDGPGRFSEKAPSWAPPLRMMDLLQRLASDRHVKMAARQIARACCALAFATLRGEHANCFGIMHLATHFGRLTAYGKTRRKAKGCSLEYFILCLSGVNDHTDWYDFGGKALDGLPAHLSGFLVCSFTGPRGKHANNPFFAMRLENAPMTTFQFDQAIAHVLVHVGYPPQHARRYTRHSFKHFLPELLAKGPSEHREEAALITNHVGRWAGSLLAQKPQLLARSDPNQATFVQKISSMPRNYSESNQIADLREHSQYQLDRAYRAI